MTKNRLEAIEGGGEPEATAEPEDAAPAPPAGRAVCGSCGVRTITAGGIQLHYEGGRTRLGC